MNLPDANLQNFGVEALGVEIAQMAALVETQLSDVITAFERRDITSAEQLVPLDHRIDAAHLAIERRAMALLAKQLLPEPELRAVLTSVKLAAELERVGDLAKNVAKRTLVISRERPLAPLSGVARMGRVCLRQISDVLTAYAGHNLSAAEAVWHADSEVDELYNSVFQQILVAMAKDPGNVSACTHMVFVAKNFERIGDHATNIAEALHFLMTGAALEGDRPKGDETPAAIFRPVKDQAEN